jgi:hypothetical protein
MYANYREIEERNALQDFLVKFFNGLDKFYLKEFLKDKKSDYYFVYDIYFNLFKAFSSKDGINFYKTSKKLLNEYSKYFTLNEKQLLFGKLTDFCELKQRTSSHRDSFSERELVKLYELILSKRYYESESSKYIPIPLYRNIVNFAIRIRKFKWSEKFIKIYSAKLFPDFIKDMRNSSYARINFARKYYSESLKYLGKINPESAGVKIDYKSLMIMVHYELGNYEYVISQLDSFKHFIRRTKTISRDSKPYFRDFIFFVERFIKFMNNRNKTYIDTIEYKIKNSERVVNKTWLIQKVKELSVQKAKAA